MVTTTRQAFQAEKALDSGRGPGTRGSGLGIGDSSGGELEISVRQGALMFRAAESIGWVVELASALKITRCPASAASTITAGSQTNGG